MNVHRVNYAKIGLLINHGVACEVPAVCTLNTNIPPGNPIRGDAGCVPCPLPVAVSSCLPRNYGRASPMSDMIFPSSTCNYPDMTRGKCLQTALPCNIKNNKERDGSYMIPAGDAIGECAPKRIRVDESEPNWTVAEKVEANQTEVRNSKINNNVDCFLDIKEINKTLQEQIRRTNAPSGIVIPGGLREAERRTAYDFYPAPKKTETGHHNQGEFPTPGGKSIKGHVIVRDNSTPVGVLNHLGRDNNRTTQEDILPENNVRSNGITGVIMYDCPRRGTPAPCSRVLVDDFEQDSESDNSLSDQDIQNDCQRKQFLNDPYNIWQQKNTAETDLLFMDDLTTCKDRCQQVDDQEWDIGSEQLQEKSHRETVKSEVSFAHDAETDEMFWEIDPAHMNDRNETMFQMYSRENRVQDPDCACKESNEGMSCAAQNAHTRRVRWSSQNNIRLVESQRGDALVKELKKDFDNRVDRQLLSHTNRYGENFSCIYALYHNHIDLEKHTDFFMSLDGKYVADIDSHSLKLERIPDFGHIQIEFYSFIGKKKNQKIVYHSLSEYDLWSFRTKDNVFMIYPLQKTNDNQAKSDDLRQAEKSTTSNENRSPSEALSEPSETFTDNIVFSLEPSVTCKLYIFIVNSELFIKVRFDRSFNKLFATQYAKVRIDRFESMNNQG